MKKCVRYIIIIIDLIFILILISPCGLVTYNLERMEYLITIHASTWAEAALLLLHGEEPQRLNFWYEARPHDAHLIAGAKHER